MAEGISRIEAFSDGVFAIASTLLILEIRLPSAGVEGNLMRLIRATNHTTRGSSGAAEHYSRHAHGQAIETETASA